MTSGLYLSAVSSMLNTNRTIPPQRNDVSFGLYFHTPQFSSLVTVFHTSHIGSHIGYSHEGWNGIMSRWFNIPYSRKTAVGEFEMMENNLFLQPNIRTYDAQIESDKIIKDIALSFVVWMSCDPLVDYVHISRTYMIQPEIEILKNLVNHHPVSSLLVVYSKEDHHIIVLIEFTELRTRFRVLSSDILSFSTLLHNQASE